MAKPVPTPFGDVTYCYALTIAQEEYLLGWFGSDSGLTVAERLTARWADPENVNYMTKVVRPGRTVKQARTSIDQDVEMIGLNLETAFRMMLTQTGQPFAVRPRYAFQCPTGSLY
jgi:hypothetical protein